MSDGKDPMDKPRPTIIGAKGPDPLTPNAGAKIISANQRDKGEVEIIEQRPQPDA